VSFWFTYSFLVCIIEVMGKLLKSKFLLGVFILFGVVGVNVFVNTASADCSIVMTLRVGSKGVEVQCLQTKLGINADGIFGPMTKAKVVAFQSANGLVADGIFGAKSRAVLVLNINVKTGIYGKVTLLSGNCMPGPAIDGTGASTCVGVPVSRNIYVREPSYLGTNLNLKQKNRLIAETKSDSKGYYQLELTPGSYSILVEDEGEEYCHLSSYAGIACPIMIVEYKLTEHNLDIDHAAW
jgi:hypothetical protein